MITVKSLRRSKLGPLNLSVADGDCLAITGPSGTGKSLLLRAIADLDPNEGEISTGQMNRAEVSAPEWRQHVAFLPSETGWWRDNVGAHFENLAEAKKRLPLVGLSPDALNWEVTRLSSGEKHRLGLLRCLEGKPEVLLLDEPTAALDKDSTLLVEALLQELLTTGVSILLVTHDLEQPARLGCKTMRIKDGRILA